MTARGGDWERGCSICGQTPAEGATFSDGARKNGILYRNASCKKCRAAAARARCFNIDQEEMAVLLAATHCPVCNMELDHEAGKGKSAVIDHCHMTDQIRGVICQACNKGLGMFYDRPDLLRNAAEYLEEFDRGEG